MRAPPRRGITHGEENAWNSSSPTLDVPEPTDVTANVSDETIVAAKLSTRGDPLLLSDGTVITPPLLSVIVPPVIQSLVLGRSKSEIEARETADGQVRTSFVPTRPLLLAHSAYASPAAPLVV